MQFGRGTAERGQRGRHELADLLGLGRRRVEEPAGGGEVDQQGGDAIHDGEGQGPQQTQLVICGGGHGDGPGAHGGGPRLHGVVAEGQVQVQQGQGAAGERERVAPSAGVRAREGPGGDGAQEGHVAQMREQHVPRQVVEDVGGRVVERAELAAGQGVRAEAEVELARRQRGEPGFEEEVGRGQGVGGPQTGQPREQHVAGGVDARVRECEDARRRGPRAEGEAEQEEEGDGEEEEVQGARGIVRHGARRGPGRYRDAQAAVQVDGSRDYDGRKEDEE